INESPSIAENKEYVTLIQSGKYGDIYYNVCEQGDERMDGFEKITGYKYHTIPLAADKTILFPELSSRFKADISFIGTYLPEKREMMKSYIFPLKSKYNIKLYGQDWTFMDRTQGLIHKTGQYFNIPVL